MNQFFVKRIYEDIQAFQNNIEDLEYQNTELLEYYQKMFKAKDIEKLESAIDELRSFLIEKKEYTRVQDFIKELWKNNRCELFVLCSAITLLALTRDNAGIEINKGEIIPTAWNQLLSLEREEDIKNLFFTAPFIADLELLYKGIDPSEKLLKETDKLDFSGIVETYIIPGAVPKLEVADFSDAFFVEGGVCYVSASPMKQTAHIFLIATREDIPLSELQTAYMAWLQNDTCYKEVIQEQIKAAKKVEMEKRKKEQDPIESFAKKMNWFYTCEDFRLAGCVALDVLHDDEILSGEIMPEAGDIAVEDLRGCGDTYGISHESSEIYEIKVGPLELERENDAALFVPVETYGMENIDEINEEVLKPKASESFMKLLSIFKRITMEEDSCEILEDISDTIFKVISKLKKDTIFEKDSNYELDYKEMLSDIKEDFSEDSRDEILALLSNALVRFILKKYNDKEAMYEALKIIVCAQQNMGDEEELETYIATYEFLKIEILKRLSREEDAFAIIRRMVDMEVETELFYDLKEDEQYKKWALKHVKLHGPDNFQYYPANQPGPIELIKRFRCLLAFFDEIWKSDEPVENGWKRLIKSEEKYEAEKEFFPEDPCLTSYWLIYFGMIKDVRYDEVKKIVNDFKISKKDKNNIIIPAINFFAAYKQ